MRNRPPGVPPVPVLFLWPLLLGARPVKIQTPTSPDQRNGQLSIRLSFPCPSSRGTPSLCIPSVLVPLLQKHLIFQIIFVHFVSPSSMKISLLFKSLKREFSKKLLSPPSFTNQKNPTLWELLGRGPESDQGLLGGPPPKRAHLATTRALCYKIPQPSKPWVRSHGRRGIL